MKDITDGSSSTLMVGERSFRLGEATWTGAVTGAVIVPDGATESGPARRNHSPGYRRSHVNQFYSLHSGGVNFLFGDGHVTF